MPDEVKCQTHHSAKAAYACIHSVQSLSDGKPRGLDYVRDEDGSYNGYCGECDKALEHGGGEWNDESEEFAQVQLLCELCFEDLIALNE